MTSRLQNFLSVVLGLACLGFSAALRAEDAVTWQLAGEAKVDGSGIFLSQIITPTTSSSSVVHPSTVVLPHLRLAPAPSLGQTAFLSRAQVIELARQQFPEIDTTNWTGPARVRITRKSHPLAETEMLQLLTAALQQDQVKDLGELELHLSRPLPASTVPDEGVSVKITDLPPSGLSSSFFVRCELWNGPEHVSDWQIGLQAKVWRSIPVATARLVHGELLKDAAIDLQKRDVLVVRDALLNLPAADSGLELVETVPAGMPILARAVRARPVVQRGKVVDAVYEDGSLSISLKVETMEDGQPGQTIRVRNPKTKRELFGKVKNEQTVLIAL